MLHVVIRYTYDCVKGMNYLHSKKMIHRDLKSLNLLLSSNRVVKVADFGTSKLVKTLTGDFDLPFHSSTDTDSSTNATTMGGTSSNIGHHTESSFNTPTSPSGLVVQSLLMTRAVGACVRACDCCLCFC